MKKIFGRKKTNKKKIDNDVINIEDARKARREKRAKVKDDLEKQEAEKTKSKGKKMTRARLRRIRMNLLIGLAIILIVGFNAYNIMSLKIRERSETQKYEQMLQEKQNIEDELEIVNDPEYIENQAREKLNMVAPEETLYIVNLPDEGEN